MRVAHTAIKTQIRVVNALILRETKTLFGKHKLGYLWVVINTLFSVGIFWAIRELGGYHPPHGLSNLVFLIAGFIPWYLFSESISGGLNAVGGNRALLAYPQVFPLDLLISRALLQGAMYFCVSTILLLIAEVSGDKVTLNNPASLLLALFLTLLLGFSLSTLFSSLNLIWPTTARILPLIMRPLFFISGLFFSVDTAPLKLRDFLFYNPLSHLIELARFGFSSNYPQKFVYLPYVIGFILVTLNLGLLLERYSRRYLDEVA